MKTTDKLILLSGLAYGVLFYQQDFGLNFLLFSILQLAGVYLISSKEIRSKNWWLAFSGVAIAAAGVLLNGSFLAVFANVVSLFVLAALTVEPKSSLLVTIVQSIYSAFTGVIHILSDFTEKVIEKKELSNNSKSFKKIIIFIVSVLVMLIFLGLYRRANPAFLAFTNQIDLSFISMSWIGFTLLGYYFIYQMYKHNRIKELTEFDINTPDSVTANEQPSKAEKWMSADSEFFWAKTLLIMLNVLIGIVLVVDASYLTGLYKLTDSISHSDNVHQGVSALILSIIFAVALILFFFKGRLNFFENNKALRIMAQIWVLQNVVMVMFTGVKNMEYVQEYFLTYKRIGVFIYLTCCIVGLVFTYIKISNVRSNWYLVKRVGWSLYAMSIITPIINWDALIINYNFSMASEKPENIDLYYLINLPVENYPLIESKLANFNGEVNPQIKEILSEKYLLKLEYAQADWRSYNIRKYYAFKTLEK